MKRDFPKSILFLLCFVLTLKITAQERGVALINQPEKSGKTYALIIGISDYKNISKLKYAVNDAIAFENYLRSKKGGNIPSEQIFSFHDANANKINIANALSEICSKLTLGDKFYFYFAGHGDMEVTSQTDNGLLLLHDSPNEGYFGIIDDVIEVNQLRKYLDPYSKKGIDLFYIVDACHSGSLSGGDEGRRQTAAALLSIWGREYKIMSCQPNQLSYEDEKWGGGRGLFSLKLEEAMKGAADSNNDGVISMLELYLYTLAEVTKESNEKQIPLINGDLSKTFSKQTDTTSKDNSPSLNNSNYKQLKDSLSVINRLSPIMLKWYHKFDSLIKQGDLIMPYTENAVSMFRKISLSHKNRNDLFFFKKQLITGLSHKFTTIVSPLLQGGISVSTKYECAQSARELDTCLSLLGEHHYLYPNIKARKLYMNAMALTWAFSEDDYNFGLKNTVEKAIDSLEKSFELEPNAAYTSLALGERYSILSNPNNAEKYFKIYMSLRPNGIWGKYSLAKVYEKREQYKKAEELYADINKIMPNSFQVIRDLSDMQLYQGKLSEAKRTLTRILTYKDTAFYYSTLGLMYGKINKPDSAIFFYNVAIKKYNSFDKDMLHNNIGHMYWTKKQYDSAKHYFNLVLTNNPKNPYSNFNLGSVEMLQYKYADATEFFNKSILGSNEKFICFVTHPHLYLNKTYSVKDSVAFRNYSEKLYIYKIQYFSYLNILYANLRAGTTKADTYRLVFDALFEFKEFESYTHYHYACYRIQENDINGALDSIEKALIAGFGNYFLLTSDDDLKQLRNNERYITLLKKYFPDKTN